MSSHVLRCAAMRCAALRCVVVCCVVKKKRRDVVVCTRLREILTTVVFAEQHRNHIVSIAFETIAKIKTTQRPGRLAVHVPSAIYHELSRTQPKLVGKCVSVGVDALAVVK